MSFFITYPKAEEPHETLIESFFYSLDRLPYLEQHDPDDQRFFFFGPRTAHADGSSSMDCMFRGRKHRIRITMEEVV